MKLIKGLLFIASISMLATGCSGDNGYESPFDSKYEISETKARELVETWSKSVDKTTKYIAHYSVTNREPDRYYYYKADYTGFAGEEFEYVAGSLDTANSSIDDKSEYFDNYAHLGDGFSYVTKEQIDSDFNPTYRYYLKNGEMSVFATGKNGNYSGYSAVTFNNQGLISFLEWVETEGELSAKETQRAAFESLK